MCTQWRLGLSALAIVALQSGQGSGVVGRDAARRGPGAFDKLRQQDIAATVARPRCADGVLGR